MSSAKLHFTHNMSTSILTKQDAAFETDKTREKILWSNSMFYEIGWRVWWENEELVARMTIVSQCYRAQSPKQHIDIEMGRMKWIYSSIKCHHVVFRSMHLCVTHRAICVEEAVQGLCCNAMTSELLKPWQ